MEKQLLYGTMLDRNEVVYEPGQRMEFQDRRQPDKWFSLSDDQLNKHVLLLGGPGSGKTNVIKMIVDFLRSAPGPDDVYVIFDTKGDYLERFYRKGDVVIANGEEYRDHPGYRSWNIYEELAAAGNGWETSAKEISASLFADRRNENSPFFSNAAQDLFANLLIHYFRRRSQDPGALNNRYLVEQIKTKDTEFYQQIFSPEENPDMVGLNSYFGKGNNPQGLGVFGEMKSMVYSSFIGAFCEDDGHGRFSIRDAVRRRGGRAIFIEYDLATGQALTPIYRLLVDLALKETLGRSNRAESRGRVWFILDELKLLPNCMHLEDGLNFGRGRGCSIIAGMQSVEQMYAIYGRERGQEICGGFSNVIAFSVSDYASRDYIRELFGRNYYSVTYSAATTQEAPIREREGYVVEDWDIANLRLAGEAVVGLNGHPPFRFTFSKYWRD